MNHKKFKFQKFPFVKSEKGTKLNFNDRIIKIGVGRALVNFKPRHFKPEGSLKSPVNDFRKGSSPDFQNYKTLLEVTKFQ